tara:strand:- start:3993 stop:4670 length:678 start_codon:yes stop_codon:yes gene_type:complete
MFKNLYVISLFSFTDKIVSKKRNEIVKIIRNLINFSNVSSILDIGTTNDKALKSSNFIIYQFKDVKIKKSLSNQSIQDNFFELNYNKSITESLSNDEINSLSSDIVISSATLEHVGSDFNKNLMIKNITFLTKKYFIITTPNRYYPIDFHTKLPILHWLPKKIHRKILKFLGLDFFSKEQNLDLLSYNDLVKLTKDIKNFDVEIKKIKFLGLTSNLIIFGKKIIS